jgi:alanyl-tRNA synthetase
MKSATEIRNEFIEFFEKHKHQFVPSSPVVPMEDPTLLFTNAGMNQFKDVFLDEGIRPYKRAVNFQKCIRVSGKHNDLEEVGHDTYHHTFFEMLGNWSFGDYFKKEAIKWAWELLTEVWKIPKDKLWATIFAGNAADNLDPDMEAENLWKQVTDINPSQILRFSKKDNFWEMGESGPCGPCSEIHIDLGPERCDKKHIKGHVCQVNAGCARYFEIWNLVFIQFNRDETGKLHILPAKHVDTGMGFERLVSVLQNVRSNYDTDLFQPIIQHISKIVNTDYQNSDETQQTAIRVIADHIRMLTFSIADGAIPTNEGRGYVLRRILRRAARYARKLNVHEPFIYRLVPTVVDILGDAFPEIKEKYKYIYIMEVIKSEEDNFNKTLDRGLEIFEKVVADLGAKNEHQIPGEEAFRLYDTYGFPLDLTQILAEEYKMVIDQKGFNSEMAIQRERARQAGKFESKISKMNEWQIATEAKQSSKFVGYDTLSSTTKINRYAIVDDDYHLILNETPFYAESGGQVGDKGKIVGKDFELEVIDTQKDGNDIIHICENGTNVKIDSSNVKAIVDKSHRYPTMYNHTATHLLHAALRKVLGNHVRQAGSMVAPDHMRFDFTHFKKIKLLEINEIEQIVNEKIQQDIPLDIKVTDFEKAKEMGAMALFGEKYGDRVRMISINDFSRELCGGTHVKSTGEIGLFIITQETSVASGIRRIEALTGPKAIEFVQKTHSVIQHLEHLLNTQFGQLPDQVESLLEHNRHLHKELQKLKAGQILEQVDKYLKNAEIMGNVKLIIEQFHNIDIDILKQLGDIIRTKTKNTVGFFINHIDDENRLNFVCAVTDDLIEDKGIKAGELIQGAAKIGGGGGGGRPHLATAGAKQVDKLPAILEFIRNKLRQIK